ncbi:hypothetical protein D9M71_225820 [compost metagenome]
MDKGLEHRRHEMQGADALLDDGRDQPRRLPVHAWLGHHQTRTGHQRPEELPHRHVETERGFLQHSVRGIQAVCLLHPAQAVDQGSVAVASPLGPAGGAGGVNDVDQVQAVGDPCQAVLAVTVQPVAVLVEQYRGDSLRRQRSQQCTLGEQQCNAAVFDHVGQAFARVLRVERHIGATGLENRQQANHHFQRTLCRDPYQHVRPYPSLAQQMRQLVSAHIKLRVGQRLVAEHQRGRIRGAFSLGLDQFVDADACRISL